MAVGFRVQLGTFGGGESVRVPNAPPLSSHHCTRADGSPEYSSIIINLCEAVFLLSTVE
jgi:hypothetical protein